MKVHVSPGDSNATEPPSSENQHIREGLREYCQFPHAQGFAVLLNGPWGSGKTTFIKSILPELAASEGEQALYVSLYGVATAGEIGEQLFQQIHPVLGHKLTRLAGKIISSAVKATVKVDMAGSAEIIGSAPTIDLSSLLKSTKGRVIVFDDFERGAMTPASILGYINPLIEHDDCKVIIIADESQISDKDDYYKRKEKTVGRTYEFKADVDSVFDVFLKAIDDTAARDFLKESKPKIIGVFRESGFDNLRLLQHALWDFERLWKILTEVQRRNEQAINEILLLVCASAIEFRAGGLTAETFRRNDIAHHMALQSNKSSSFAQSLDAVFKKYPSVNFGSTLIDSSDIVDLVINTRTSPSRIQEQLRQHPYFAKWEDVLSWRAVWSIREFPSAEHAKIVDRFEADFRARTFRQEGQINHVIGLALWLSKIKFPGWAQTKIIGRIKRYIDDVYKDGAASIDQLGSDSDFRDGADGLGYMSRDDPRFFELVEYHKDRRRAWKRRAYPSIALDLLNKMAVDSNAFYHDVCFNSAGPSRFARLDVLQHIPPKRFAAAVAAASGVDQRKLLMGLSTRYEQVGAEKELQEEVPWLHQVKANLDKKVVKLPIVTRDTLSALVAEYVTKTLSATQSRLPRQIESGRQKTDDG